MSWTLRPLIVLRSCKGRFCLWLCSVLGKWQGSSPVLCYAVGKWWGHSMGQVLEPWCCGCVWSMCPKVVPSFAFWSPNSLHFVKKKRGKYFFPICSKSNVVPVVSGEVWLSLCHSCLLCHDRCKRSFHHGGMTTTRVPDYQQCVTPKVMECKWFCSHKKLISMFSGLSVCT